ncbi:MAG: hypothetical protein KJT01_14165, partial [Gemmatimonadetes bacterium]|nr:hypothetical protein [Gemmatimonadota bacterium]
MAASPASRRPARPARRRPRPAVLRPVLLAVLLAGCEPAGWDWVDAAPVTGAAPAPVAFPPDVPRDTFAMADADEARLRTADLLR